MADARCSWQREDRRTQHRELCGRVPGGSHSNRMESSTVSASARVIVLTVARMMSCPVLLSCNPSAREPMQSVSEFSRLWKYRYFYDVAMAMAVTAHECPRCSGVSEKREGHRDALFLLLLLLFLPSPPPPSYSSAASLSRAKGVGGDWPSPSNALVS